MGKTRNLSSDEKKKKIVRWNDDDSEFGNAAVRCCADPLTSAHLLGSLLEGDYRRLVPAR
jgi:hypothetical protein